MKIKQLFIEEGELIVETEGKWKCKLYDIKPVKPKVPLFTTEDGKTIHKGEDCFAIRKCDWLNNGVPFTADYPSISLEQNKENNAWWYFSTQEAADNFELLNKPIEVSYKQLKELFYRKGLYSLPEVHSHLKDFFKTLIKP